MNQDKPSDINHIRREIDDLDNEILKLLAERRAYSLRIAKEKGLEDKPSEIRAGRRT